MRKIGQRIGGLAIAAAMLAPFPAAAFTPHEAEQIRRLDIMLMVTSLRCRTGGDDFRPEYGSFSAHHLATLNDAARTIEAGLVRQHGAAGAKRALDRISVGIANQYGLGHPWLGCGELKQIATRLSQSNDPGDLSQAAGELLAVAPPGGERFATR